MRAAVFGLIITGLAAPAVAQEKTLVQMQQGQQVIINTTLPFSSASVADPEVVDALPKSDRTLVLVGRKIGTSDIIIFQDATPLYHATVSVNPSTVSGKVYNHNKKNLNEYYAYQCNPVCTRVEDKFESRALPEVVVLGGAGGASATGGAINVIMPPQAGAPQR